MLSSPVPMEELMMDLKGGNGTKKQQRAQEEIQRRMHLQAEKDLQDQCEQELRRQKRKERDEWVTKALEDQQRMVQEQFERERLAELEAEQLRLETEEQRLGQEKEQVLLKELRQPKTCSTCNGSGKCSSCGGSGCTSVMYLSSVVDGPEQSFRGRTATGCTTCGGRKDGGEVLELTVMKGHGKCLTCMGDGQIRISEKEVQAAVQIATKLAFKKRTVKSSRAT
jgi:hypothetical protein